MVNEFCNRNHVCVKYICNNCDNCEYAQTFDLEMKSNSNITDLTYSEYNKGETKMKNYNCPYRIHCGFYARNHCDNCEYACRPETAKTNYGDGLQITTRISDNSKYGKFSEIIGEVLTRPMNIYSVYEKPKYPGIKKVTISGPATIIFWDDGTKTVMKCSEEDKNHYDPEKAILLAFYRKVTGFSKTHTQKELDKLTGEAYENIFIESLI